MSGADDTTRVGQVVGDDQCPTCEGWGYLMMMATEPFAADPLCPDCDGSGRRSDWEPEGAA